MANGARAGVDGAVDRVRAGAQTAAVRFRTALAAGVLTAVLAWPGAAPAQTAVALLPAGPLHADPARPVGMALLPLDAAGAWPRPLRSPWRRRGARC